jgi:transposase
VNHRQRLVNQRRDLKLRVGACLREQRVKIEDAGRWSRRWVDRIKAHGSLSESVRWVIERMLEQIAVISGWVEQAEERLRQATEGHAVIGRLRKIEGIGEVTAWWLLGQVGRFDRFRNGKQLARYCGLSPRNRSSGSRQADGGLIEGCCEGLRAVLIQAAQRLVRTHERWKALAAKLRAKGKAKCVVIAAVANRWVRSLHHRMVAPAEQAGVVQE